MPAPPLPDVVAIGETMVLVAPALAEPLELATGFHLDPGGAEANVASHLAALGRPAAWAGVVGDDALGRRLVRQLGERGVDTRWVGTRADAPTGVYFKDPGNGVRYYRSGSAASRMDASFLGGLPIGTARVVHLSGITPALSDSCDALAEAVVERAAGDSALVSFDVNHRPALWAADAAPERLRSLAARADLVFVGLDEAAALWGTESAAAVRALLPQPRLLVVKDAAALATEFSEAGVTEVPAFEVEVVEPVGAGDAFAAGYLDALLANASPLERVAAGHSRAVTVLGDTADFPRAHSTTTPRSDR
ncbi:sugar kinase [Agromyces ramosus]|uniref:2-dehydro-3-deoxygluconokinase n=1 Tax=Agromyces ramosus TaxID=33879 RepID=A0ABU0RB29_9MICO|nr:sugar kinase [Agromyces ramosus]MDQ0895268.1 2-dehydro-3-deoxygluconokinase [Agromyces ramosus]